MSYKYLSVYISISIWNVRKPTGSCFACGCVNKNLNRIGYDLHFIGNETTTFICVQSTRICNYAIKTSDIFRGIFFWLDIDRIWIWRTHTLKLYKWFVNTRTHAGNVGRMQIPFERYKVKIKFYFTFRSVNMNWFTQTVCRCNPAVPQFALILRISGNHTTSSFDDNVNKCLCWPYFPVSNRMHLFT